MPTKAKDPTVTVRMYRQGLGDCFLISIGGAKPFHMLIDCGVWDTSAAAKETIQKCAKDIAQVTGGSLDLLVVTHEHWDHVSGFSQAQARQIFDSLRIAELMTAWTENPDDPVAIDIRAKMQALKMNLAGAIKNAQTAGLAIGGHAVLAASGLGLGTDPGEAFTWLKQKAIAAPDTKVTYALPGNVYNIPGARLYVLGPPHDPVALRKTTGGARGEKSGESYLHAAEIDDLGDLLNGGISSALFAASKRAAGSTDPYLDKSRPFGVGLGIPLTPEAADPYAHAIYDQGKPDGSGGAWRRIDTDWTSSISELALRMDKFTNNTSLVLAIELLATGRVLLFPADAQFGNWMSWDSVKFESRPEVTAEDLLRRTVLYKVGHHGSHNATLRKRGIDRMTSPDLVAMIPVDEEFAHRQPGGGWSMPYPALNEDLKQRTRGRVLRADKGLPDLQEVHPQVRAGFKKAAKATPLCVSLTL